MSDSVKKLTDLFAEFPTIGTRTAGRFVLYLIKQPKEKMDELASAILELKNKIKLCAFCFNPHETENHLCEICRNTSRNGQLLCVVEKETDLISIENAKKYNGLYFVLEDDGFASPKELLKNIRIIELKERIENPQKFGVPKANFSEIIIAVNSTAEGRAISALVERTLKDSPQYSSLKVTHLGRGLPFGGELEYADEETLESAFEGRK